MKYVVNTDELRHFATRIENGSLEHRDDRRECARAITAACKAIESFAQTLGEPVAVPNECRHVAEIADINGEALCAVVDIKTPNVLVVGDKLYLHPAAAPHHPTTEKGCD